MLKDIYNIIQYISKWMASYKKKIHIMYVKMIVNKVRDY